MADPTSPRDRGARRTSRWAVLGVGILAVSSAAILIRLITAPALAVGAWRLTLATAMLTPWALGAARREWPRLERHDWARLILAGLALALHFGAWISSLRLTSVASSVILVSTTPLWVALAGRFLLGERLGRATRWGLALSLVGTSIVSFGDLTLGGAQALTTRALLGNGLALLGAISVAAYLLLGRAVRRKLSTLAYVWPCYGIAAGALWLTCLFARQPLWGYDTGTFVLLALLALGPQVLGHSAFNWALAHFSPVFVTLALLGEPIGATALAWLLLGEAPTWTALGGGALILVAIVAAARDEAPAS
jgi:drug/metabolite transporter (DMT)-like permease